MIAEPGWNEANGTARRREQVIRPVWLPCATMLALENPVELRIVSGHGGRDYAHPEWPAARAAGEAQRRGPAGDRGSPHALPLRCGAEQTVLRRHAREDRISRRLRRVTEARRNSQVATVTRLHGRSPSDRFRVKPMTRSPLRRAPHATVQLHAAEAWARGSRNTIRHRRSPFGFLDVRTAGARCVKARQ